MIAAPILDYIAGDTLIIDFTVTDQDGDVVDLTNATAVWKICLGTLEMTGSVLVTKTLGSGVAIIGPTEGKIRVTISKNTFTRVGEFVHALKVTLANGEGYTVSRGLLKANAAPAW